MKFQFKPTAIASAILMSTLGLSGCGGGSSSTPTTPTNSAPTNIALSNNVVAENAVGATIGTLSTTDADANESFTYVVDNAAFTVSGSDLKLAADTALDFETAASIDISVTVTDSANHTFSKGFTINVSDVLEAPTSYSYESRFNSESSVSYGGQIARQVLIADLFSYIGGQLQADVDNQLIGTKEQALAKLKSYYDISTEDYDLSVGDRALMLTTNPSNMQSTLKQISASHKDLKGKIAGKDPVGQHQDWANSLVGWNTDGSITPDGLVIQLMETIADNVQTYIDGAQRFDTNGSVISQLYVTEDGRDLNQLLQKFLLGAVAFSQATDDYLDDSEAGKGLLSDNSIADGSKPYTPLEHSFDEGFGYFGAARNYNEYSDAEVAKKGGRDNWQGYHDSDEDGAIDLNSEFNFGNSTNAAKRDLGSADNAHPTDFSKSAFDAFLMGRAIITAANGALDDAQMTALKAQRDVIVENWEKSISATVIHYINEVIADMSKLGSDNYNFAASAKHWSELKGFALNFQFNPRTPLSATQFAQLHQLIGMKSATSAEEMEAYKAKLLEARDIIQTAYGFDADNVLAW